MITGNVPKYQYYVTYRRANYFQGYKIFEDTQNFTLNKNFGGKNFEVMDNPRNFYRT